MRINITNQHYDKTLLLAILFLCAFGIVMLYSASWNESYIRSGGITESLFLINHIKRMILGFTLLFIFLKIDYKNLKSIASYFLIATFFLLIITKLYYIILGISSPARWLYLGFFSIQTSDIARLSLMLYLAFYLEKKKNQIRNLKKGFLPCIFIISSMMALIVIQPDFSTSFMIGTISGIMVFIAGAKIIHIVLSLISGFIISLPILYFEPYRWARIISFWNKIWGNDDTKEAGYQAYQGLLSLGNGGIFGVGLGNSIEKNRLLPTPHTDFIFSIIGEELGLIGTFLILSVFILIFYRGIIIAKKCTDPFGVLLALGIAFNLVLYAFVNAAVVTGLFPVTGLPMPMISYGGSGMVINMALMGILLNISQSRRSVGGKNGWSPTIYD